VCFKQCQSIIEATPGKAYIGWKILCPTEISVVEIDEPLPHLNFEAQKKLSQKAVLRKSKKFGEKINKKE